MNPPEATPVVDGGLGEPFVGRHSELSRLEDLLRHAVGGSGGVVLIAGESGIGKTVLAGEFLRRARAQDPSLTLCRGRCIEQYGAGEAYLPFLDLLGSLLLGRGRERTAGLLRTYAPTWCLQLPATVPSPEERETLQQQTLGATKERMLRELGDVLEAAASSTPLVGLLEDLQWADPSSVDLLRHLSGRIARQRMLVLGTYRMADLEACNPSFKSFTLDMKAHRHCHEIPLGPLKEEHVAGYLEARFAPHRFPPGLAGIIHKSTDGHPLFVASLVEFLAERGDVVRQGEAWALTRALSETDFHAPESVRDLIRRRVEARPEADQTALQYASVMGREFLSTVLAKLLDVDELALEERLGRLDRVHRLIDTVGEEELPDGALATRYRFANALYQEVLYDDLVGKRRVLLHRQVAEQLARHHGKQAPRLGASLAVHFERGRDFAQAATFQLHAGDNASRLYANDEAEEHYVRALRLVEKLPPEEQAPRARALFEKRGALELAVGRPAKAAEHYTRMLELARAGGTPAQECVALMGLCDALFFSNRIEEMAVRTEEALRAAARAGSEELRAEALLLIALILQHGGDLAQCTPLLDEVLELARPLGRRPPLLRALAYRGCVHYWQSEYALAEERLQEALGLASELRDWRMVVICNMFLGLTRGNLGRMSESLATLEEAMALARRNGDRFWLPRLANHVGWIHRELQDFEGAIAHDQEGLRIARENGVVSAEASALLNLALDHTQAGEVESASAVFEQVPPERETWFGWLHEVRLSAALADHWLRRGDLDRAADSARRLLEQAMVREARTYVVGAHTLLAEVALARGELSAATAHLAGARQQLRAHPAPLAEWKTYAMLGRLRATLGDHDSARKAWGEAAAVVKMIAANVTDAALKARFLGSPAVREVQEGCGEAAEQAGQ